MKKTSAVVVGLIFVMLILQAPVVFAGSPMIDVSGTITSGGTPILVKEVGENRFLIVTTASTWSGDISGSTTGFQTWIMHLQGNPFPPPTHININVELLFTTATVDGKTGTMTIEMNMIAYPSHPTDNHGTWRIKDAAGELEGLKGQGAWLSSPNRYEGKVHFTS